MFVEVESDLNLIYLEQVLFSLDNYKFEKDILIKLSELRELVNKKVNSSLPTGDYYIDEVKFKQVIYLKNEKIY